MDSSPANILVVDDVEDNLEIVGSLLTFDGYNVQTALSGAEALERVQANRPDLILLDILMPGMSGFEVCDRLKAEENTKDIPIVFFSSMADIESKVKGFKIGAVDYINKPFQHAEILVRVNTHVTIGRMRRRLEEQNTELQRLANTDYLTDLYNRRHFFGLADKEFTESIQNERPTSVTMIDLDHFKRVNDTYGHLIGSQVLIHIAHIIRDYCREEDMAARYGGEEFAIWHPNIEKQVAFQVVEGIRKKVEATPFVLNSDEISVTLSAGIVDTQGRHTCPRVDALLDLADKALYRAKDAGRNQVVVYDE